MGMSAERKRQIERDDEIRRILRDSETDRLLNHRSETVYSDKRDAHINSEIVRGIGVVSPPNDARVTARGSSRAGRMRWSDVTLRDTVGDPRTKGFIPTVGVASDSNVVSYSALKNLRPSDGTMRVTKNGQTSIVPVPSKKRTSTKAQRESEAVDRANKMERHHTVTASELAAIGNVE